MATKRRRKTSVMVPIGAENIIVEIKNGMIEFKIPQNLGNEFTRAQLLGVICDTLVALGVIIIHIIPSAS